MYYYEKMVTNIPENLCMLTSSAGNEMNNLKTKLTLLYDRFGRQSNLLRLTVTFHFFREYRDAREAPF